MEWDKMGVGEVGWERVGWVWLCGDMDGDEYMCVLEKLGVGKLWKTLFIGFSKFSKFFIILENGKVSFSWNFFEK